MTGRETATVETLTASVKTLMVGARQVTLTIFKQLDVVGYHEMTPFGRVSPNGHETDWATIVGRRNVSGELVRGRVPVTREAVLQHTGMSALARDALRAMAYAVSAAAESQATVDEATAPYMAVAEEVSALPLIVLAGLA